MITNLTHEDLNAMHSAIGSVLKAGAAKEAQMKPGSIEQRTLQVNREIIEKLEYAGKLLTRIENGVTIIGEKETKLELNRVQAKVLLATIFMVQDLQKKAMEEYSRRPPEHPSFQQEVEGRRKEDYENRLKLRMQELSNVVEKVRKAL